jgi:hypothetical protein
MNHTWRKQISNLLTIVLNIHNKFWEELIAYFPFTTYYLIQQGPQKKVVSNSSIVACVFVAAATSLLSHCQATHVSSDSTIPVFMRHVTFSSRPQQTTGLSYSQGSMPVTLMIDPREWHRDVILVATLLPVSSTSNLRSSWVYFALFSNRSLLRAARLEQAVVCGGGGGGSIARLFHKQTLN